MSRPSNLSEFLAGFRLGIPVFVAAAPFALLFGALAVENGFTVGEAVLMSVILYAGASQMVGIEMFGQQIAPWLIIFSIFAVNFRHVLYSGAVGRRMSHWSGLQKAVGFFFLIDAQYAEVERLRERGEMARFAWFMGMAIPIYVSWVAETWIGAMFGRLVPDTYALGLDFLLPIYFLGLVMGFRNRPLWLPVVAVSAIASIIAFETIGSPWHVTVGAVAGILLAAVVPPSGRPVGRSEEAAETA